MTGSIADLYIVLDSVTDPFSSGLKKAASDAESMGGRMSAALGAVAKVGLGVGIAVGGIAVASVKAASEFQTQMTRLSTAAGAPKAAVDAATSSVLKLGTQVGFTGTQMAEALYHPISTGMDMATSLQVVKYAAEEAQISGASLENTTYSLSSVMKSFNVPASQAAQTMAQLNAIVGQGDTHFQDFNVSIKNWAPTAASMGISITSIGSAIGYLTDRGNSAEEASTRLTMGLSMMATPSHQAAKMLEGLGVASSDVKGSTEAMTQVLKASGITQNQLALDLQKPDGIYVALTHLKTALNDAGVKGTEADSAIAKIFGGGRSDKAILALMQDLGGLQDKFNKVTADSTTTKFESDWEGVRHTFAFQMDQIKTGAENLGIELGTKALPMLSSFITQAEAKLGPFFQSAGLGLQQIASGFTGKQLTAPSGPTPNMGNAMLNAQARQGPQNLTALQRYGQDARKIFDDLVADGKKLEPVAQNFIRFGEGAYQAFTKIVSAVTPTVSLLGHGLFGALDLVGKILVNVVEPPLKWFADFLASHKTLVEVFAVGAIGLLGTKMAILGGINAAKSVVGLATAIVQFPLNQAKEISGAVGALKTAYTGRDAADGQAAIKGLRGAFDDLKTSATTTLDKFTMFDGAHLAGLAQAADGVAKVDKEIAAIEETASQAPGQLVLFGMQERAITQAADPIRLGEFGGELENIARVSEQSPGQLALFEVGLTGIGAAAQNTESETAKLSTALDGLGAGPGATKLGALRTETEGVAVAASGAEGALGTMAEAETASAGEAEKAAGKAGKLAGVLGDFGLVGGVVGAAIGGIAVLTGVISAMNGAGDHTADTFGKVSEELDLVAKGSASAQGSVAQFAAQLGALYAFSETGRNPMGEPAGLTQLDQALGQMVKDGHAGDAKTQFEAITQAFQENGLSAQAAARMFPQYEDAMSHAGDVAQTTDGKIKDMTNTLGVSQSLTQFNSDVINLTQSLKDNGNTIASNTTAGIANQQAFQQAANDIVDYYNKQRAAGVATGAATSTMQTQVQQIEALGAKFGISKGDVDRFLGSLGLIKPQYGTTVNVNTAPAINGLNALLAGINSSHATVHVDIVSSGAPSDVQKIPGVQAYAAGGPFRAGQIGLVGEDGPELMQFGADGYITPTSMIKPAVLAGLNASGSAGYVPGGGTRVVNNYYTVNVAGSAITDRKLVDVLRTEVLQYQGRNSSNGLGG